jgi:hypothetical protein
MKFGTQFGKFGKVWSKLEQIIGNISETFGIFRAFESNGESNKSHHNLLLFARENP